MSEVSLEQLPIHEIKSALKERGIKFKRTDKKPDLIKMLRAGESKHPENREIKRMPHLAESKTEKSIPVVPKEIRGELEQLAKSGLKWEINEHECTITFSRDIDICANLDQSAHNILKSAKDAFAKAPPIYAGISG